MAAYTVTLASSYIQAMAPMIEILSSLEFKDVEKVPQFKFEDSDKQKKKISSVNKLLEKFNDVSTDILLDIDEDTVDPNVKIVQEIEQECVAIGKARGDTGSEVIQSIRAALATCPSEEELQSSLFDILGFEQFELISKVIKHKDLVLNPPGSAGAGAGAAEELDEFMSAEQRAQLIVDRAERTKHAPLLPKLSNQQYPHVFKKIDSQLNHIPGKQFALPQGTTRESLGSHEEINIPHTESNSNKWITDSQLVKISALDFLCKGTFKNYKTLNKMQSLVFPVAYNTNENMLVCAPTGAGKTDVALLTILHTINQFTSENSMNGESEIDVDYDEFKIIYVAPLKALAAEIVDKYAEKLSWLGISVRELTGDMQLTRQEIAKTQIIVTTPEKWDVVTRKQSGDNELVSKVRLLIIDEVHLLHEDRGSVIETLVARTLRQVESTQLMIRVVGLSATLPNYMDVADFLGVNRQVGMFYFDQSFRPCPLKQQLIGVRGKAGSKVARDNIDRVSYDKLVEHVARGLQVMVFVNSRRDTVNTAKTYIDMARSNQELDVFDCSQDCDSYDKFSKELTSSKQKRNKDMRELFSSGFGIHHAGMLRSDRNLTEKMFLNGAIKVLCCTATLAWGVNLPAAVVIVKGTQLYDSKQGGFVDLGISDVLQIFGRAGRPQYAEKYGTGILCTTSDKIDHYVSLLCQQHPIESKFIDKLVDNLNAEISLGTVTNVDEAVSWMGYTYMMVRMRKNPQGYGIRHEELQNDPLLIGKRHDMITLAARRLHALQMIVFDEPTGSLIPKDLGRVASDFYLLNNSIEIFNQTMNERATLADVLGMVSMSSEFDGLKLREEEKKELKELESNVPCQVAMKKPTMRTNKAAATASTGGNGKAGAEDEDESQFDDGSKTNILLQSYISNSNINNSALLSDCNYVAQNSARICRALFLIAINRRWGDFLRVMLSLCKSVDKRVWSEFDHPMTQFDLPEQILRQIRLSNLLIETLRDMDSGELGELVHNMRMGSVLYKLMGKFPFLEIESEIFPVTSNVMRIHLDIEPDFNWDERYHGGAQMFWVMVEGQPNLQVDELATEGGEVEYTKAQMNALAAPLLHVEKIILNRRLMGHAHSMDFMIPLLDPLPSQIVVRVVSDSWIGSEAVHTISFQHLIRPLNETVRTKLLRLQPLPISALQDPDVEHIYNSRFQYFNPMQTMTFHSLYNTNSSVFVGSPTGSGKTVVAELAIWHALRDFPGSKIVYIAPMKALVRERVDDWRKRLCGSNSPKRLKLVELTGDSLPEARDVREADIIVTTPEKFDGISRNWKTRKFVQKVSLVIMDEIHLLASDRGPILEMIVSRMNYISLQRAIEEKKLAEENELMPDSKKAIANGGLKDIRLLGMSTAVSNAMDMAGWLRVKEGLFNFSSLVRPVPLQMYIDGFPDNLAFCPLMKAMNKPAFMAIKQHSPTKPVLIFVASRRQTRLTALDLIHLCGMESNPRRFLKVDDDEIHESISKAKDDTLKLSLQFGIGLHHAGLVESDRQLSHKLFELGKIQILVATSTLAWGVNLPAHLVIIKGTQFFDSKIEGYRDMDLTDILQMMGRAGRPAFDTSGTAIVYTRESKKTFYKHFLNVGFPVESSLHKVLDDHLGAEISAGTVTTRQEAMDFLTWTFLYRRAHNNPTYYGIEDTLTFGILKYLAGLIDSTIDNLVESRCVLNLGQDGKLLATPFLHISSYYYLSHKTMRNITGKLKPDSSFRDCLGFLCEASEYDELATRHGEELINMEMSQAMRYPAEDLNKEFLWDPHVKAYLLLQAFMSRVELPIADYAQDTVSVLDHSLRVLQAYVDTAGELGYLQCVVTFAEMMRSIKLRSWYDVDPIAAALPGVTGTTPEVNSLKDIGRMDKRQLYSLANKLGVRADTKNEFIKVALTLPTGELSVAVEGDTVHVEFKHENEPLTKEFRVYCPQFPKDQRESWFVCLCDMEEQELILLKRASPKLVGRKGVVLCDLVLPEDLPFGNYKIKFLNDAIGLEYQEEIEIK